MFSYYVAWGLFLLGCIIGLITMNSPVEMRIPLAVVFAGIVAVNVWYFVKHPKESEGGDRVTELPQKFGFISAGSIVMAASYAYGSFVPFTGGILIGLAPWGEDYLSYNEGFMVM